MLILQLQCFCCATCHNVVIVDLFSVLLQQDGLLQDCKHKRSEQLAKNYLRYLNVTIQLNTN